MHRVRVSVEEPAGMNVPCCRPFQCCWELRSSTPRATPLKTIRIEHRRGPHTLTDALVAMITAARTAMELGDEPFESALIHEETAIYEDGIARTQALAPRSDRHRQPPTLSMRHLPRPCLPRRS